MSDHVSRRASKGVSLVEVLVALVVLSVGLLGVAALLVQSVRGSRTALLRTQAVNLVSDMADRIRANASAGDAYGTAQYGADGPEANGCAPTADVAGDNCTSVELAQDDIARWLASVRATLPGAGEAVIAYDAPADANSPERYAVSVAWEEPGERNEPDEYSYSTDIVLMPRSAP
jgi:type IV pilus assembly protein PilV